MTAALVPYHTILIIIAGHAMDGDGQNEGDEKMGPGWLDSQSPVATLPLFFNEKKTNLDDPNKQRQQHSQAR
jgi:hypothetical protein